MDYDFDQVIDRTHTEASKVSDKILKMEFGETDLLPMWVADMDFKVAPPILEALHNRVDHGIFGYTYRPDRYYNAIIHWTEKRFDWTIEKDWIVYSPGIVPAISYLIQTFCDIGDQVIIQQPVYYPFSRAIKNNGCDVVNNALVLKEDHYVIDFDDFESKAKDPKTTMFILCSPHNPVSRVWTEEELKKLGKICIENDVLIVADEIHNDLVYDGYQHTMFASINHDFAMHSVTCTAPSKTFNIAGLKSSNIIIPNKKLREHFKKTLTRNSISLQNPLSIVAVEAAYRLGEGWLEALLDYLSDNQVIIENFLKEYLPKAQFIRPEGTYLAWIDFRAYEPDGETLEQLFFQKGGVAMDGGTWFGASGAGFMRLNYACPKSVLKEGLNRIKKIINDHY